MGSLVPPFTASSTAQLLAAVRQALEKSRARQASRRGSREASHRLASLTSREREVLECVVAGRPNKQIAGDLGIAEKTVKVHRGRLMKKLGAPSVAALVRIADQAGVRPFPGEARSPSRSE